MYFKQFEIFLCYYTLYKKFAFFNPYDKVNGLSKPPKTEVINTEHKTEQRLIMHDREAANIYSYPFYYLFIHQVNHLKHRL